MREDAQSFYILFLQAGLMPAVPMPDIIHIDGAHEEGGGQIVRTALALSTLTGRPFSITDIRKGRSTPGLKMQHLFGIKALEALCSATSVGAKLGATSLDFFPKQIKERTVDIDIGTAGSITLLLQAVLLPCVFAKRPVRMRITGGTDVAWSMPIDYLKEVYLPHLQKYAEVTVSLQRRGYYPKGGGLVEVAVKPKFTMETIADAPMINLIRQGDLQNIKGISHASESLSARHVAERQALAAKNTLKRLGVNIGIQTEYGSTLSDGSGMTLFAQYATRDDEIDSANPVRLGADALGEISVRAEVIGESAAKKLLGEMDSGAAVDSHLADNLIPLLGLIGGEMKVSKITPHTKTNMYVTELFLGRRFEVEGNTLRAKLVSGSG